MSGADVPPLEKEKSAPDAPHSKENAAEIDEFGLPIRKIESSNSTEIKDGDVPSIAPPQDPAAETPHAKKQNGPPEQKKEHPISRPDGTPSNEYNSALRTHSRNASQAERSAQSAQDGDTRNRSDSHKSLRDSIINHSAKPGHISIASEWSHQQLAPQPDLEEKEEEEEQEKWETMPAYAPFDLYNDDGKLIAKEQVVENEDMDYGKLGGAGKGYTRVQVDDDAQSATSMDENTAYLFKEPTTNLLDEDEEGRDVMTQMQATKDILTEGQRIAYVGIVRLAMIQMLKEVSELERTRHTKKAIDFVIESTKMWSQKIMVRLYSHMEIESAEQVMIEQLAEHGVEPGDLTPSLMKNARVKNPMRDNSARASLSVEALSEDGRKSSETRLSPLPEGERSHTASPLPSEDGKREFLDPDVKDPSELPNTQSIDIDLRWTILCDLFLVLIADSVYDSRSRRLLERVGEYLEVSWLDICRFEKRVTDALEMQQASSKENWNEEEHMDTRQKQARNKRLVMMGLATVGGGLVIGLSAGLLAPVIGAGLAAGFTTIGVAGTSSFLAGAGGAAIITTTGIVTGGNIGLRASDRRTGAVKTFEYRPLHNNKRVNLIVTVAGWMNGKIDDVRLPYSTVDPIMGDIYSIYWEPEMLQSMGDTINILATEALTQGLQQILGSTILVALMAALQLPIVLTKLAYLIDNPWTVSLARADLAGLILADSLIDRNLGSRPITLVGFSLGSRVIYACLRELAKKGQCGIIQNVYLFGSPMVFKKDEYIQCRTVVSGRFVNGYATNDWILGYLFRATSGGIMRVAGLAPVLLPGVENYDVTEWVPGHMSYRSAMPRLLREVGWIVESDEFTEIEDPDPENHEKRQRELINEIEEARKQLQEKPKSRFAFFKRKKLVEKKEWEMYDDAVRNGTDDKESLEGKANGVLFDIDALQKEVADLAAQGITVKELPQSTLPPMKLVLGSSGPSTPEKRSILGVDDRSHSAPPSKSAFTPHLASTSFTNLDTSPLASSSMKALGTAGAVDSAAGAGVATAHEHSLERSATSPASPEPPPQSVGQTAGQRPTLNSVMTAPLPPINLEHNAWADEFGDDFGKEKELQMTFE